MTKKEAIELATSYAAGKGYETARYIATAAKKEHQWSVSFNRDSKKEKPGPGDFFTVHIDEKSQKVELFPGK